MFLNCLFIHFNKLGSNVSVSMPSIKKANFVCFGLRCLHACIYFVCDYVLRQQGYNEFQNTLCDVGMHFGNLRQYSVKIGYNKKLCMSSAKRRLHFVNSRHIDAR